MARVLYFVVFIHVHYIFEKLRRYVTPTMKELNKAVEDAEFDV
ncbi:hypothetical protein P6N53_05750 [Desulforamulus aquiferis]|uniref:Uncharacterized protein n=1 Tax=Desulforamulus aquiferis TaxID=1397668 RepID=A0AAW7ZB42_9FIRM|nr:hypothetical protein [Desulforamulus aquiferis]MDO7786725.1 hypothetical protein [Desulforamulus aquiferis]